LLEKKKHKKNKEQSKNQPEKTRQHTTLTQATYQSPKDSIIIWKCYNTKRNHSEHTTHDR
ncbi:hypothetical protein, partial [Methylobacterium radiotolerans]|uniref:hypothetical protein n=1 Tax=Methylobacterium radiotolerans TaxID=31998 RepID=UPI001AECFCF4